MATRTAGPLAGPGIVPCLHRATATSIGVVRGAQGEDLRRRACGLCHRGWWECDGTVIEFPQAIAVIKGAARVRHAATQGPPRYPAGTKGDRPDVPPRRVGRLGQVPTGFLALLNWVCEAIGTDLVLFAATGPEGWQMISRARPTAEPDRAIASTMGEQDLLLPAEALGRGGLLRAVAVQRRPSEFTRHSLTGICPDLVAAGVSRVVGALYIPSLGTIGGRAGCRLSCPGRNGTPHGRGPALDGPGDHRFHGQVPDGGAQSPEPAHVVKRRWCPSATAPPAP